MKKGAAYSPTGIAEMQRYLADLNDRVREGKITVKEGKTLASAAFREIVQTGHLGDALRRPTCGKCGAIVHILGADTQRFRCGCSPEVEQSVFDGVRRMSRTKQPLAGD